MRPRLLIVSYHAANPLTPRGARTQAVAGALSGHADVRIIAGAPETGRRTFWHRARDRAVYEIGSRWLIDPQEPWSRKVLGSRDLAADCALLIGYPFSPPVFAARSLRRQGVPYLLDSSDPWAATTSSLRTGRLRRLAELERELWSHACGGIVTTAAQAHDVRRLVPGLDVLVRPNGYAETGAVAPQARRQPDDALQIGHFGNLYAPRLAFEAFFDRLAESGLWRRIVVHQYGRDDGHALRKLPKEVTVRVHRPIPWPEVVRISAAELDVALVIGNKDARQLPSKAIEYLTLPIPRLALAGALASDALAEYAEGRPGWLTLGVTDPDAAPQLWEHVHRRWAPEEFSPPRDEAWTVVADQLAGFVLRRTAAATAPAGRDAAVTRP